ncbi:coiled-coil domain-containing protein 93-like isoform X2 [Papaver somniferum]|uniref:coiled-coil domain-containing protein 93-like isoform X2 n=1 Tax=Papaver somniferum TaxID=3469 RepID=UPI000E6FAC91|nr:coiled-coil domain-containing protein 93-like isoform X2 [Papaver somniferum]
MVIQTQVKSVLNEIEEEEQRVQQLEEELNNVQKSTEMLRASLNEQIQKKATIENGMQRLRENINEENGNIDVVQRVKVLLESVEALEKQEGELRTSCEQKRSNLQAEVNELERISNSEEINSHSGDLQSFRGLGENWQSAKTELAAKLRAVLSLKRRLDDQPSPSELIQYERRFSELYVQIQEKHQQTRQYYATYNALLEIKELVQKETSLLNSISSQFQDAMTSTAGRAKLIGSMEAVLKGTQQKLGKVQLGLQEEQRKCDVFKEENAASVVEQRRCSSILKAFQIQLTGVC